MTLLILYIAKRLVWTDNIFGVPEQLVDSDVGAGEGSVSLRQLLYLFAPSSVAPQKVRRGLAV